MNPVLGILSKLFCPQDVRKTDADKIVRRSRESFDRGRIRRLSKVNLANYTMGIILGNKIMFIGGLVLIR